MVEPNGKLKLIEILVSLLIIILSGLCGWSLFNNVAQGKELAALKSLAESNSDTLRTLLKDGSPGLQKHEAEDNSRVQALMKRMDNTEEYVRQSIDLKVEVRVLAATLDQRLKSIENKLVVAPVKQ